MKKLSSLLLSVLMLLGTVNATIYAEIGTQTEEIETKEKYEISVLSALGLLDCFKNIPSAEDTVTRAEFTTMIMHLMYEECAGLEYSDSPFVDVNSKTSGFNYICAAYNANIIHGSDGKFYPDRNITYSEAVRILVDILGANVFAVQNGGYPGGYIAIASQLGINDGVLVNESKEITFAEAAKIYLNTLNIPMYECNTLGSSFEFSQEETLIEAKRDIYYGEGILNANQYTSLNAINGLGGDGMIKIGNHICYLYESFLPEKYLGYYVEYYYDEESDEVLYISPVERKNEIIHIKDIEIDGFSFADRRFSYTKEDSNRSKNIIIPANAAVIFNGKNKPEYKEADLLPSEGSVELIDNDMDGNVDVVIVNKYETFFVGSTSIPDMILIDYYKTKNSAGEEVQNRIDLSDEVLDRTIVFVDSSSEILDFSDIKKYDVVSVLMSDDGTYVRCIVSRKEIEGTISSVEIENNKYYITLDDGNRYIVRSELQDSFNSIFTLRTKGKLYLDDDGRAAGFVFTSDVSRYGFYIKGFYNEDTDCLNIKLMDIDGNINTYKAVKKFMIDGQRINTSQNLPPVSQVVIYTLDKDNNIRSIDTATKNQGEAENSLNSIFGSEVKRLNYYPGANSFRGVLSITSDMPIFIGPVDPAGASNTEYRVTNLTELVKTGYDAKAYNTSKKSLKADVIHIVSNGSKLVSLSGSSKTGLITDKYMGLNEDDEVVNKLVFAGNTKEYEVDLSVDKEGIVEQKLNSLNIGDFVAYNISNQGKITNIDYMLNIEKKTSSESDMTYILSDNVNWYWNTFDYQIGYIYNIDDDEFGITKSYPETYERPSDLRIYTIKSSTKIYLVDSTANKKRGRVSQVTFYEMRDYMNYGEADMVIVDNCGGNLSKIVIYR